MMQTRTSHSIRWWLAVAGWGLGSWGATPAMGNTEDTARVGRVGQLQGAAWVLPVEAATEWLPTQRNEPVVEGDRLRTDAATRVEVQVGSSSLWVASQTELSVTQLDDSQVELSLRQGTLLLRVREPSQVRGWRLLTPEGSMAFEAVGMYRIDRRERSTTVRALQGEARFLTSDAQVYLNLRPGPPAECQPDTPTSRGGCRWVNRPADEVDRWASTPWAQAEPRAPQGVSPEMTGVQELNEYGRWEEHPEHGAVWTPTQVRADWEPFRFGTWTWVHRWGWTWVDETPWGFAPFHYGRWLRWQGRWVWWPGQRGVRLVWLPASVSWLNAPSPTRPRIRLSPQGPHGSSHGGWKPLAPHEPHRPVLGPPPRPTRPPPALQPPEPVRPVPVIPGPPRVEPAVRLNSAPRRVDDTRDAPSAAPHPPKPQPQPHEPRRHEQEPRKPEKKSPPKKHPRP